MNDCVEPPMGRREFLMRSAAAGALAGAAVPESLSATERRAAVTPAATAAVAADPRLARRQLDSRHFTLSEYGSIRPALAFPGGSPDEVRAWQVQGRAKLNELLGGFPERVPLDAEVLETHDMGHYTRETLVFQTRENLTAYGYLLLPKARVGVLPALVCIPGHGRGVDDIVGIEADGTQRTEKEGYAKDFAIQAVEQGYATLAIEPLGFGHRRDEAARASGPAQNSCRPSAGAAMLFGTGCLRRAGITSIWWPKVCPWAIWIWAVVWPSTTTAAAVTAAIAGTILCRNTAWTWWKPFSSRWTRTIYHTR